MIIYQSIVAKRLKQELEPIIYNHFPAELNIIGEYISESSLGSSKTYIAIGDDRNPHFFPQDIVDEFYE